MKKTVIEYENEEVKVKVPVEKKVTDYYEVEY